MKKLISGLAALVIVMLATASGEAAIVFNGISNMGIGSQLVTTASIMPIGLTGSRNRQIWSVVNDMVNPKGDNGKRSNRYVPAPDYLRIEQVISNASGVYSFDVKKSGNETSTERKLDRNDLFVITDIGVYLSKVTAASNGAAVKQSYPNPFIFGAANEADHLETVYNGNLSLKIGSRVNIEGLPMDVFRHVPETQQTALTNRSAMSASGTVFPIGGLIYMAGNTSIEIKISCPIFNGMAWASAVAGVDNKIVFVPYGFLVKDFAAEKAGASI